MTNSLLRYIGRQTIYTIVVMAFASTLVFLALRVTPGDPVNAVLNPLALEEAREAMRQELGLNQPIWVQYGSYIARMLQGHFGTSILNGSDVGQLVSEYGQRTLILAGTALLLTYLVALPLGVMAAVRRNSVWDQIASFLANLGMAVPNFWMALLLILLFSVSLRWLPVGGTGTWAHLVLPVIVLSAEGIAVTMRLMRTSMLEQLSNDYIRTLRAKGLSRTRVIWVHAVRNALTPIISLAGLRFGWLIGYTLIVETVFRWPGLGYLLVDSVLRRDYPVAQTLSLLLAVTVLLGNFLANVAHAWVDPRIRDRAVR
jgi:ABC-type dipeptide/oligopeptide/nickel transport system permease component